MVTVSVRVMAEPALEGFGLELSTEVVTSVYRAVPVKVKSKVWLAQFSVGELVLFWEVFRLYSEIGSDTELVPDAGTKRVPAKVVLP